MLSFENGEFFIMANVMGKKENKNFSLAIVYGPTQEDSKYLFFNRVVWVVYKLQLPFTNEGGGL